MNISAEFEMDPQHGPIVRVIVDGTKVAIYLDQETGVVTPPTNRDQYGIEVTGPWWKFRQYQEESWQNLDGVHVREGE